MKLPISEYNGDYEDADGKPVRAFDMAMELNRLHAGAGAPEEPTTLDGVANRLEELRLEREHLLCVLFDRNGASGSTIDAPRPAPSPRKE